jgi:hypothetical protein
MALIQTTQKQGNGKNAVALFCLCHSLNPATSTNKTASPAYIFPNRVYITASDLTKIDHYLTKVLYSAKSVTPQLTTINHELS